MPTHQPLSIRRALPTVLLGDVRSDISTGPVKNKTARSKQDKFFINLSTIQTPYFGQLTLVNSAKSVNVPVKLFPQAYFAYVDAARSKSVISGTGRMR